MQIGSAITLSVGPDVFATPPTVTVVPIDLGLFYGDACV